MKVKNNTSIFVGDETLRARHQNEHNTKKASGHKAVNGGALLARQDPITARRNAAKKKAMKIVGDVFAGDLKIDDDIRGRRERIQSLKKDLGSANRAIREIEDDRAALRGAYGVKEDDQEEKDLKLLEKEIRAGMPGSDVHLSKEDMDAIGKIKANGLTEYQQRSLEMLESEKPYAQTAFDAENEIKTESSIISATKLERLKSHAMTDAEKQADEVMDAASREIVGMLVAEAKEHIDEEAEKREEQAKAEREKQEEIQERIDAAKEKKKENEELTEEILEGARELAGNTADMNAAQQEIKDMMSRMKLIEDDIKGAEVDKSI